MAIAVDDKALSAVVPLYIATGMSGAARGALFLLLPINSLHLGGIFSGFAVPGMLAIGGLLVNLPAAFAVARFGAKRVMVLGLCLGLVAALVLSATESLALMGIAALAYGLGMGVWGLARLTYVSEAVPSARRGRALAPLAGAHRIGMFLGPGLAGLGATAIGSAATLLVVSALVAVAALVVLVWTPRTEPTPFMRGKPAVARVLTTIRQHQKTLLTAGLAMGLLGLLRGARLLLIPVAGTLLGLSEQELGLVKSLSAGADMLLFYPAGEAMDRLGRKWTALPCLVILSLGVMLIGSADDYTSLLIGGLVAGFGNGLGSGINMTLASDYSPEHGRADFIGVWRLITDSGAALSPFILGAVASIVSLAATGMVGGALGLLGAVVMGTLASEPLRRG